MKITISIALWLTASLLAGTWSASAMPDQFGVEIGGERFMLEVADNNRTRGLGLAGRDSVDANGGMIFVFPEARVREFFMRDCLIPIDIMFLDSHGAVTATYTMLPEEPRGQGESASAYEQRLKRYSSRSPAQYAVELRAGTLDRLGLGPGVSLAWDRQRLPKTLW